MNINMKQNEKKALIAERSRLYRRLFKIRDILPGAFSCREIQCGKMNCICNRDGNRHRVYQYSYKIGEKQVTKNIPKQYARQVEKQVLANKEFKKIMNRIHKINLEILCQQIADRKSQKQKLNK
jgi:hypothetical protein